MPYSWLFAGHMCMLGVTSIRPVLFLFTGRKKKSSNVGASQAKTDVSQRIKDMNVTKKAYTKWKPLSSPTKDYVKQIAESTVP